MQTTIIRLTKAGFVVKVNFFHRGCNFKSVWVLLRVCLQLDFSIMLRFAELIQNSGNGMKKDKNWWGLKQRMHELNNGLFLQKETGPPEFYMACLFKCNSAPYPIPQHKWKEGFDRQKTFQKLVLRCH